MNTEAQRKAASSLFTGVGDKEVGLIAVETAPVQGNVEYSTEMTEVGFPS